MRIRSSSMRPLEPLVILPRDRPTGRLDDAPHMAFTRGLAVAVLALLLLTLVACGGGGGGGGGDPVPPTGNAKLQAVTQPGDFIAQVKSLVAARAAAGQRDVVLAEAGAPSLATANATTTFSTTTRQEEGVDEDDLVKTDGRVIYSFSALQSLQSVGATSSSRPPALQAHRRAEDGSLVALTPVQLAPAASYEFAQGLQLATGVRRLAALRRGYSMDASPCPADALCFAAPIPVGLSTSVDLVDLAEDGSPGAVTQAQIQGDLVASRLIGHTLYLVTTHQPFLRAEILPTPQEREQALATMTASEVLPSLRVNGAAPKPLLAETDCYLQATNTSTSTALTTITAVDLSAAGFTSTSRCFLGGTEAITMAQDTVYLSTTRWPQPGADAQGREVFVMANDYQTDIHKFSVEGSSIRYRASGSVHGHLGWDTKRMSYRMSEHAGDLRVLSFTGAMGWATTADATSAAAPPPSPATLSILRENSAEQSLELVGALPNANQPDAIGKPDEQVYAVRFVGDRAYVVTFLRTDPLYVLDLSDPTAPVQTAALEVTGFSEDLYPVAEGLLLGVGKEADANGMVQSVKLSLFDVQDARNPKVLATETYGGRGSTTALEHSSHGISFFAADAGVLRVALPMALTEAGSESFTATRMLQRLEVDTVARTLRRMEAVAPPAPSPEVSMNPYDLWSDRSLHIGGQIYYYAQGAIHASAW